MNTRLLKEVYDLAKEKDNLDIMLSAAYALPEDIEPDPIEDFDEEDEADIATIEGFLAFLGRIR
jgi:hypothetical protein